MGQYYKPVNLDKQEFIRSSDYGSGLKLMEHSWLYSPMVCAVVLALAPHGTWYRDRLVWAGDYMDGIKGKTTNDKTLYDCCRDQNDKDQKPCITQLRLRLADGPMPQLIVNHDTMEYVKLSGLPEEDPSDKGWHIHPLPLLTCSGNGRGGGDFRKDNPYVGTWAGQRISAEYNIPDGYNELFPNFTERNI